MRVVVGGLAALVLVAKGVARAALGHVDGLIGQLGVAGLQLRARLMGEALHVDGV